MSFCKDCFVTQRHEGTPTGKIEQIGGVETYVAVPDVEYPKDKAVLFLTDVFGVHYNNNQLLADDFARNGFQVYMPDLFAGDALTEARFAEPGWSIEKWFPHHGPAQTRPPIDAVLAALKERGITAVGATSYCFGSRYAVDLARDNTIQAAVLTHPSLLKIPDDFQALLEVSKVPLLINSCETDSQFPPSAGETTDALLGAGKYAPGYERTYWPGCTHGFAVRGDPSVPAIKEGKEGSFKASVEFFFKYI